MKIKARDLTYEEQKEIFYNFEEVIPIIPNLDESIKLMFLSSKMETVRDLYKYMDLDIDCQKLIIKDYSIDIYLIDNPMEEIQIQCVAKYPNSIFYIKNPCKKLFKMFPQFNFDLDDDLIIRSIKRNIRNLKILFNITPRVEEFILNDIWGKHYFDFEIIPNPTRLMIKRALDENNYLICKLKGLDKLLLYYFFYEYIATFKIIDKYEEKKIRSIILHFLLQKELELDLKIINFIISNYKIEIGQYLSYDIVNKLLEINAYNIKKYKIKDSSLLEKYRFADNLINVGLL